MDYCAICRGELAKKCQVCSIETQAEQNVQSLTCPTPHIYHKCCIETWLKMRAICPLCSNEWKTIELLSLKELCALKILGDVDILLRLLETEIDDEIYEYLDKHASVNMFIKTTIKSKNAKRVLAKYFSQFLDAGEVKRLCDFKLPSSKESGVQSPQGNVGTYGPQGNVGEHGPQGNIGAQEAQGNIGA